LDAGTITLLTYLLQFAQLTTNMTATSCKPKGLFFHLELGILALAPAGNKLKGKAVSLQLNCRMWVSVLWTRRLIHSLSGNSQQISKSVEEKERTGVVQALHRQWLLVAEERWHSSE
jgi:hypothetical protein